MNYSCWRGRYCSIPVSPGPEPWPPSVAAAAAAAVVAAVAAAAADDVAGRCGYGRVARAEKTVAEGRSAGGSGGKAAAVVAAAGGGGATAATVSAVAAPSGVVGAGVADVAAAAAAVAVSERRDCLFWQTPTAVSASWQGQTALPTKQSFVQQ